jgi:hypothetical protein
LVKLVPVIARIDAGHGHPGSLSQGTLMNR